MTPSSRRLLSAWTALVLAFLWLPIAVLVAWSFNDSRLNVLWKGFTLRWYAVAFSDAALLRSLGNSLWVAAWTKAGKPQLPLLTRGLIALSDGFRHWWWLIALTIIGLILLIIWACMRGTIGANRFGPDPLAGQP